MIDSGSRELQFYLGQPLLVQAGYYFGLFGPWDTKLNTQIEQSIVMKIEE